MKIGKPTQNSLMSSAVTAVGTTAGVTLSNYVEGLLPEKVIAENKMLVKLGFIAVGLFGASTIQEKKGKSGALLADGTSGLFTGMAVGKAFELIQMAFAKPVLQQTDPATGVGSGLRNALNLQGASSLNGLGCGCNGGGSSLNSASSAIMQARSEAIRNGSSFRKVIPMEQNTQGVFQPPFGMSKDLHEIATYLG